MMQRSTMIAAAAVTVAGGLLASGCQLDTAGAGGWHPGRDGAAGMASTDAADVRIAREDLARLAVAPAGSMDDYDRDEKFGDWETDTAGCDTRAKVLKRHGMGVRANEHCTITGGAWTGAYSGEPFTDPSELDIDHVVSLADAWRSGAASWGQDQRGDFANDMFNLAVADASLNRARGDYGPAAWQPPHPVGQCRMAVDYITTKHRYDLTITSPDKQALSSTLDGCPAS